MVRAALFSVLSVVILSMVACAGPSRSVKREKPGSGRELSGNWSSVDAKETSEALVGQCFTGGWLSNFVEENGTKPAVRVAKVVNKTDEHIDAQVFVRNLEKAMVNSGKVTVLAQRGSELDSVREEQDDAISGRIDEGASVGGERGGDFVLTVYMSSILDQVEGEKVKFYKLNATLQNASTAEKVWIGDHEIQKYVTQNKVGW